MITVTRTFMPSLEDYITHLQRIWKSGQLTNNGELVIELAEKLEAFLGVRNLELVSNGTLALQLAIKALDIRGEVITTPYSYVATATSIIWEGCDPVFVDIENQSFCINADLIEEAITEKTTAILATHVYGYPCDVEKIEAIARRNNLKVIYDAAHCFGVRFNGKSLAAYGDISTLSLHATKVFHTAEGGGVVCRDNRIAERISLLKKFGHVGEDQYLNIGINAKLSELHAAMGLCILPKIPEIIAHRRACTERYDQLLDGLKLQRPAPVAELEYNYAYYPVIFPSHESMMRVRAALMDNRIMPRRYFFPSLNRLPYLPAERQTACPVSEDIAGRVLSLPMSHALTETDIQRISAIIRKEMP